MSSNLLILDEVNSTNTYLKNHFDEFPDAFVVAARHQTAGRGRLGRQWIAPANLNLTASIKFTRLRLPFHAGAIAAVAMRRVISELLPGSGIYFKWPNDLYSGTAKLGGILSEGVLRNGKLSGVVCGLGLNVNSGTGDLLPLGREAVSLSMLAGRKFSLDFITKKFAFFVNQCYIRYCEDFAVIIDEWQKNNRLIGRAITLHRADGTRISGVMTGIADDGALLFQRTGGTGTERFDCGDVSIGRLEE